MKSIINRTLPAILLGWAVVIAYNTAPAATLSKPPELSEPTGVITLSQILALTLTHNPELAAFAWEMRSAEARELQAGLLPNPEIELEVQEFGGTGMRNEFNSGVGGLKLSQLIELGDKRSKRVTVAALSRDVTEWDYEIKRLDVLTETAKAYIDVLEAQARLDLSREAVRLAEQLVAAVAERVNAGKVSPLEEVRAGTSLTEAKIVREQAGNALTLARKRLCAAWGSRNDTFEKVAGDLDALAPLPSFEQLSAKLSQNPGILRLDGEEKLRQAALELEMANRVADLTLSGGIQRFYNTHDTVAIMGISVPIPLFNRNQGGILEAQSRLNQMEEARKETLSRAQAALAGAYEVWANSHIEARALKGEVLPAAQRTYDALNEGYRMGKFGYLDILEARRSLLEARERHIAALSACHKAEAEVKRLMGEKLATAGQGGFNNVE